MTGGWIDGGPAGVAPEAGAPAGKIQVKLNKTVPLAVATANIKYS